MIKSIPIDEVLQRVSAQPKSNIWLALIISSSDFEKVVNELKETLSIFLECKVGAVSAEGKPLEIVSKVGELLEDYLLIWNFETWTCRNWQEFDYLRSRLDRDKHGGTLVLSLQSAKSMFACAPNFVSWLGSRIFCLALDEDLITLEERQMRLSVLQEWSGLSDSEVVELAEAHKLPSDPEYGEWLILLDREDLIER